MIEDDTGSDWTLAEGATGSTSSDYGDVLPEKQHSASSLVSEEKAVTEQPPSRDALIAKASKPLEVYRKVPETVYHAVVVGGFRVGKTTFLRMLDRVFARRPGCATSIAQGGEVVTISFMDSLASGRHIFEFREKHVSDQTGGMDVTDVLAYISDRQKEYQNLEQDAARLMPMSELADARVDLCLWLLPPQELTSVEVDIISAVWERLPVIPIISKADSLDAGELEEIRANVAARLEHFYGRFSKDGIVNLQDLLKRAGAHVSGVFSTINSVSVDSSITSCGWPVKAYPWGSVEPFLHSDLQSLLSFIMEKLPQTLKLETEIRYRASLKVPQDDSGIGPKPQQDVADSSEVASVIAAQWSSNMLAVPPEAADVAAKMIAQADVPDSGPLRTPKPLSGQGSHTVSALFLYAPRDKRSKYCLLQRAILHRCPCEPSLLLGVGHGT